MKKIYSVCLILSLIIFLNGCCKARRKKPKKNINYATGFSETKIVNNTELKKNKIHKYNNRENKSGISDEFNFSSFSNEKFLKSMYLINKQRYVNAEYTIRNVMNKYRKDKAVQMQGNYMLADLAQKQHDSSKYKQCMDKFLKQMYDVGNSSDIVKLSKIMDSNQKFLENSFNKNDINEIGIENKDDLDLLHKNEESIEQ